MHWVSHVLITGQGKLTTALWFNRVCNESSYMLCYLYNVMYPCPHQSKTITSMCLSP